MPIHLQRLQVRTKARPHEYEIIVGHGTLSQVGEIARRSLGSQSKHLALISNRKVFSSYGSSAVKSLKAEGFHVRPFLIGDGEKNKSVQTIEKILHFLNAMGLERNDAVVALGGGVVGDVAGFAAAIYLRGVSLIQIPTTLLAQIDSSVGGKTGVNLLSGKNLVGAFHQPRLVLIDLVTLQTLPARELTSGWCEAVKQGAVGDRKLFERTIRLLKGGSTAFKPEGDGLRADAAATIAAHCRFKASIVAGDERESTGREDAKSRRILNFGHTTAHALEAVTAYGRFRHGEAVGYGMLVAGEISKNLGMLAADELESLREAVRACGSLPRADDLEVEKVLRAMKGDKKSVAGQVKWVLLEGIGKARIVNQKEIDTPTLKQSLRAGLSSLK